MITRCEHCGSKFEVNAEIVYSNDPAVRCGECLSLFDARACLFNEAEFGKIPATLKPVQKRQRVEQPAAELDTVDLETADTVAVEHFYTSEGARNIAESGSVDSAIASATTGANAGDYTAGSNTTSTAYNNDRNSSGSTYQSTGRSSSNNPPPRYSPASSYQEDIEFERTAATESLVAGRDYQPWRKDRDPVDYNRPASDNADAPTSEEGSAAGQSTGDISSDAGGAANKKQVMREREQRALQVEPDRDFDSQPVVEDFADKPGVIRGSGFRTEEDTRFQSDTPRFDTSLDGRAQQSNALGAGSAHSSYDHVAAGRIGDTQNEHKHNEYISSTESLDASIVDSARQEFTQADYVTQDERDAYVTSLNQEYAADDVTTDDNLGEPYVGDYQRLHEESEYDGPAIRDEPYVVPETSAREVHRYQQGHQSLPVKALDDEYKDTYNEHVFTPEELLVEREARTRTEKQARRQSSAGSMFWLMGLVVAIGLFLFAARSVIANMNLPEPVITSFCQITGCVPAQAKKDVSQLQTMRQRLYPHPEIENAFVISVDVVNSSVYKQPLPTLAVSLLNAENQLVAERDFVSTDYEIVDGSEPGFLMPNEPTRIKIEVVDTGLAASEVDLAFK